MTTPRPCELASRSVLTRGSPLKQHIRGHGLLLATRAAKSDVPLTTEKTDQRSAIKRQRLSPVVDPEGPTEASSTWTLEDYQKLFRNYRTEDEYEVTDIEGRLPSDLEGTFYRNGPGITELGGQKMHCFDGHGLIARIAIQNGRATFKSRYVRTPVFEEEVKANKVLYRGFGSTKPGGVVANFADIRDKPVANTSVLEWGGKLYALWEAHNPFVLDPRTLETLGEETFGGILRAEQPFTAHPARDRHTGNLVAFSNGIRHGEGKLHIWEINANNKIKKAVTHKVGLLPVLYLHDFRVTKNWYIFHQAPLGLNTRNVLRYLAGGCDQTQQVFFDQSMQGKWWLVPRDGGEPLHVETDPLMIWHYGNAFEDEDTGKVTVDACTMDTFSFGGFDMRDPTTVPTSEVARFEINPKQSTSVKETLLAHSADFPQTNPVAQGDPNYRYLFVAAATHEQTSFPFRRVIKLDVHNKKADSWLAPAGCFVGEPIFVARKPSRGAANGKGNGNATATEEDDGYLVCLMSDGTAEKSSLLVFDAANIQAGPISKLNLNKLLPMAFHCAWSTTPYL